MADSQRDGRVLKFDKKVFSFEDCARMDVFSFAVLLYSVALMDLPYTGVSPFQVYARVGRGMRPSLAPLRNSGEQWAASVADLIEDCWATDPATRPAMDAIAGRLRQVASFVTSYSAPSVQ
jgi:hypothetical protein